MPNTRRQWSHKEKSRIVSEAFKPGADKKAIAKREGVALSLIYRWEKERRPGRGAYKKTLEEVDALFRKRIEELEEMKIEHQQAIEEIEKEKADIAARLLELAQILSPSSE